jgi:nitrogen fixation/metabolism regulation signal transduction histidine kinase
MTLTLTQANPQGSDRTEDSNPHPDRRLLTGYLHKTSNTLCGIKGYASLIAGRELPDGQAGQWARKIILEVERMEEIFRSVGDLTRGRQSPDTGIDLPRYVSETAAACAENLGVLNLSIGDLPAGELRLPAADLALILHEVLKNCAESAGTERHQVKVEMVGVTRAGGRVFLEISDNGCGMNRELTEQATAPFITTKDNHHGVGLTRVDTLMEMYRLQWGLDSEEGQGTRVFMEVAEEI